MKPAINILNEDCLARVFMFLPFKDLSKAQRVCRKWQQVIIERQLRNLVLKSTLLVGEAPSSARLPDNFEKLVQKIGSSAALVWVPKMIGDKPAQLLNLLDDLQSYYIQRCIKKRYGELLPDEDYWCLLQTSPNENTFGEPYDEVCDKLKQIDPQCAPPPINAVVRLLKSSTKPLLQGITTLCLEHVVENGQSFPIRIGKIGKSWDITYSNAKDARNGTLASFILKNTPTK